jgi:hypothetical protein
MAEIENLDKILVLLEITDGYSFRNTIDYIRYSNSEGNFIFSKDKVSYKQHDGTGFIMNILTLHTYYFAKYIFNSKEDEDILAGVLLAELQSNTKNIGKKDGVRLYLKKDDPHIYIQILSTNKGSRNNISFVRTKEIEYYDYLLPDFERSIKQPNANAVLNDFAKTCKNMAAIKCDYVIFQGYSKGVMMSAYLEGQLVGKGEKFGDCDNFPTHSGLYPDIRSVINLTEIPENTSTGAIAGSKKVKLLIRPNENIPTIRISSSAMTALSKTNNTSQNGIILMLFEDKKPARFIFPIGYYGELTVLIRDQATTFSG